MTVNQAFSVSHPNYSRPCVNKGGVVIPKHRIVKYSGNEYQGGALATSAADNLWGISTEEIGVGVTAPARSIQVEGCPAVETGGAFDRGAKLTSDSTGRAVLASDGDSVIGRAANASTGAGEFVGCEMAHHHDAVGNVQMLEVTITHADLTTAATTETENIGAPLPENARILAVESELTAVFAGGTANAVTVSLGISGTLTSLINARNIFTGQALVLLSGNGARPNGTYSEAQLLATFTTTADDAVNLTAGSITFRIFYTVQA